MRQSIMNYCHYQTHSPGKMMATKVAFAASNVYCNLGPWGGQCGNGLWSEPTSLGVFFVGNLWYNQI